MGAYAIAHSVDRPEAGDLVDRARAGEVGAFEGLYRQHAGRVFAICMRMTADPARAEDHTQDAFVNAWSKLDRFRGGDVEFPGWLRKVAINVVLGERRARARRPLEAVVPDDDRPRPELAVRGPAPVAALDLEQAIAGLPGGARDIFVLHDVEGYKHTEIAEMLDVTVGTTKAQLHRARKMLREALR